MKPGLKWSMILGGGLTVVGPVLGVLFTTSRMWRMADTLGGSGEPVAPELLASHVGAALIPTAVGMAAGAVGLVIFLVALARVLAEKSERRSKPQP